MLIDRGARKTFGMKLVIFLLTATIIVVSQLRAARTADLSGDTSLPA
jgi:hypothetical protein